MELTEYIAQLLHSSSCVRPTQSPKEVLRHIIDTIRFYARWTDGWVDGWQLERVGPQTSF